MNMYRFVYRSGIEACMTQPQHEKMVQIANRFNLLRGELEVQLVWDAVGIDTGSMFIVVLPDGSSHS